MSVGKVVMKSLTTGRTIIIWGKKMGFTVHPEIASASSNVPKNNNSDKGQSCKVMISDKVYSIGHKHRKLYKLNSEPEASCCFESTDVKDNSLSMWHSLKINNMIQSMEIFRFFRKKQIKVFKKLKTSIF